MKGDWRNKIPIYVYHCKKCGLEFDQLFWMTENSEFAECPKCHRKAGKDIVATMSGAQVHTFEPFWHKHLDRKPIYITSMKQLKEECKKRGLTSPYAEGATELWGDKMPEKAWKDRPRRVQVGGGKVWQK